MLQVRIAMLMLLSAACGQTKRVCATGVECASGICQANGTCAPLEAAGEPQAHGDAEQPGGDADLPSSGDLDLPPGGDGEPAAGDAEMPSGGDQAEPEGCVPNHDGTVTPEELPLVVDVAFNLRLARHVAFNTAGVVGNDGIRRWDFGRSFAGDTTVSRRARPIDELWSAGTYEDATYAIEAAGSDDMLAVYERTAGALLLRGISSFEGGYTQTELTHDPPLTTLTLPFSLGDVWESDTVSAGWAYGYYSFAWESITSHVTADMRGMVDLDVFQVPVVRVVTTLTRHQGAFSTVTRHYAFVSECLGVVAWALGEEDDDGAELTRAAEVARIAP